MQLFPRFKYSNYVSYPKQIISYIKLLFINKHSNAMNSYIPFISTN